MTTRRFPVPWSVCELEQAFRIEARQGRVLTRDEARRIAANIANLPKLLLCKAKGSNVRQEPTGL